MNHSKNATRRYRMTVAALVLISSACGGSGKEDDPIARCKAMVPIASQGVAGCAASENDIGDGRLRTFSNLPIRVYLASDGLVGDTGAVFKEARTDGIGHFDIQLDSQRYRLCTQNRCVNIEVGADVLVRNFVFGLYSGWDAEDMW